MQLPVIKTFNGEVVTRPNIFFVLSKGENAGKPLQKPCPNCFTVECLDEKEREYWFWLCWGLWKSQRFHIHLRGSVIEFIRIDCFKKVLSDAGKTFIGKQEQLSLAIETMIQLEECQEAGRLRIQLMEETKRAIFHKILHR